MYDLAISVFGPYRHLASALFFILRCAGLEVFLDEYAQLPPCEPKALIQEVFLPSRSVLILDTPGYGTSQWTEYEMRHLLLSERTLLFEPNLEVFDHSNIRAYWFLLRGVLELLLVETDLLPQGETSDDVDSLLRLLLQNQRARPGLPLFAAVMRSFLSARKHPGYLDLDQSWDCFNLTTRSIPTFYTPSNVLYILNRLAAGYVRTAFDGRRPFRFDRGRFEAGLARFRKIMVAQPCASELVAYLYLDVLGCHPTFPFDDPSPWAHDLRRICRRFLLELHEDFRELTGSDIFTAAERYASSLRVTDLPSPSLQHRPTLVSPARLREFTKQQSNNRLTRRLVARLGRFRNEVDRVGAGLSRTRCGRKTLLNCSTPRNLFEFLQSDVGDFPR